MAEKPKSGVAAAVGEAMAGKQANTSDVVAMVGGVRGFIETSAPGILFLISYSFTKQALWSAIAAGAVALVLLLVRLIRKEPLMPAISAVIAVVFCAVWMLWNGNAVAYYEPGFWINAAWITILTVSLLVRWPLLGVIVGAFTGDYKGWRKDRLIFKTSVICTLAWILLFAARLAVQLPLYYAGAVEALGVARLVMGVPLYALFVLATWQIFASALKKR